MRIGGIALLAACVAACGGGGSGGGSGTADDVETGGASSPRTSSSGLSYTVESYVQPYEATTAFLADPSAGLFIFEAGIIGGVTRTIERYPQIYDPNRLLDPSGGFLNLTREIQVIVDSALHSTAPPKLPHNVLANTPLPEYVPDWDHDGVFGNPGDWDVDIDGDAHGDDLAAQDTAYFFYPCPQVDGSVLYETANGDCVEIDTQGASFKFGVARELKIVDSRGLVLDATLWVPGEAFAASAFGEGGDCPVFSDPEFASRPRWLDCVETASFASERLGTFPGLVFSDGFLSRQEQYYWIGMRFARAGYLVVTHDPAGQGESEGTLLDLFVGAGVPGCEFPGSCHDTQDVVRWFVGDDVMPVANPIPRLAPSRSPAYLPKGENFPNPALAILDRGRIAIAGHSMGGFSTLSYLNHLGSEDGLGTDGRPLPRVRAAVSFAAAAETRAAAPIQFQTADGDGSPTLFLLPGLLGVRSGTGGGNDIGPQLVKERYDALRREDPPSGDGALSLLIFEGGTHADWAGYPLLPRSVGANAFAGDAAVAWLDCHVKGDGEACDRATSRPNGLGPTDDPGADFLSRAFASEHDPDGPSGPTGSLCIKAPDQAHLNLEPAALLAALGGSPPFDCEL